MIVKHHLTLRINIQLFIKFVDFDAPFNTKTIFQIVLFFIKNFSTKVNKLNDQFETVDSCTKELIKSYGEDELTFNLDDFLKNFYDFSINMSKAREVIYTKLFTLIILLIILKNN